MLEQFEFRGYEFDSCPHCSGIWLDVNEFNYLTSERDVYQDNSLPRHSHRPAIPDIAGYLPCVSCGQLMIRRNFKGISGVFVDLCRDHGVWFDAGELESIRAFVANGG